MTTFSSAYEQWVQTLKAWVLDPRLTLEGLPELRVEDYSPETFSRLFTHVNAALEAVTQQWNDYVQRVSSESRTTFEFSQGMVASRRLLQRRVDLSRHPGLPEQVRDALTGGTERDIRRMQEELEGAYRDAALTMPAQRKIWEERLLAIRQNPFTAVLGASDPIAESAAVAGAAQPSPGVNPRQHSTSGSSSTNRTAKTRWAHRRIT